MKQVISVWLPSFSTDRITRFRRRPLPTTLSACVGPDDAEAVLPLVTFRTVAGRLVIEAANPAAVAAGLVPGQALADARARVPELRCVEADDQADARLLDDLADWCSRYTPWTRAEAISAGQGGIWLDITGCAHLFGGAERLVADLLSRIRRFGLDARAACAPTPGAAWALARFDAAADQGLVVTPLDLRGRLRHLPVSGLRLPPAMAEEIARFGLRRIGDLYEFARGPLVARFGALPAKRLDQAMGRAAEPIAPRRPVIPLSVRHAWPEPVTTTHAIEQALEGLLERLCRDLETRGLGARRLELAVYRLDGAVRRLPVGMHVATRDAHHLARLMVPHIDKLGVDAGVEVVTLSAPLAEALDAQQLDLDGMAEAESSTAPLIDRLVSRLGSANLLKLEERASHLPERAQAWRPSLLPAPKTPSAPVRPRAPRPVRLLARPEPVDDVLAMVPDEPPRRFRWRGMTHAVRQADGPERIAPEWWCEDGRTRDYYRVEDDQGRRFWLFREGLHADIPTGEAPPRWYLHGFFA